MVTETETDADLEFSAGNFNEACELYSELLALHDCSDSQRMELLKKLGASQQRATKYEESLVTYKTLLTLQDNLAGHDSERIVTYLRLAEAYDHCANQSEAETEFKRAHDLAAKTLPVHHMTRKSVIENYTAWLLKTNGDKALLKNLKQEMKEALGTEINDAQKEDHTNTPSTRAVLVTREVRPKSPRYSNPRVSQTQISFSPEASPADMLSDELETDSAKSPSLPADKANQSTHSDGDSGSQSPIPLSASRANHENNTSQDWSNLAIHPQYALKGSARSYFKTHSSAELDQVIKDERSWQRLAMRLAPVVICAVIFGSFVTAMVNEPASKEVPPFVHALIGKSFATIDGSLTITATKDGLLLTGAGLNKKVTPSIWRGSFSDEFSLMRGDFKDFQWLRPVKDGLQDQTGLKFLGENAPEAHTVKALNRIAASAQHFYQNNHRYPVASEAKTLFSYRNPCTDKLEPVRTYTSTTFSVDSKIKDKKLDARMMRGESFEQEMSPEAGSVAMLSVINKPNGRVELPDQPIECQYAYIHAFDRNGRMLTTPTNKPLVIALEAGSEHLQKDKEIVGRYADASLAIAPSGRPGRALVLSKYIGCLALVFGLIFYLIWIKSASARSIH